MEEEYEICCSVTPLHTIENSEEEVTCETFAYEVFVTFTQEEEVDEEGGEDADYDDPGFFTTTRERKFLIKHQEETIRDEIKDMLRQLGLPLRPTLVDKILSDSRIIGRGFSSTKLIPLRLNIDAPMMPNESDDGDQDYHSAYGDEDDPSEADEEVMVPATESSIERLERVKVEEGWSNRQCSICLEEILVGSQATRLPCKHGYHNQCIRNWLEKSGACPLCRFQIKEGF